MVHRPTTKEWMAAAFAVGLAIVLIARWVEGPGERVSMALRATARWSFLLFWLASAGSALTTLFGSRFLPLARRARDFGLAFASAHLAHLGVVAWIYSTSVVVPRRSTLIFFGIAVFWTYLLAILSWHHLSSRLNPRVWSMVRTVGVEYIAFAFWTDFAMQIFAGGMVNFIVYLPFVILAVAGPALRLAAALKRLSESENRTVAA
jgi:hypothetical protein